MDSNVTLVELIKTREALLELYKHCGHLTPKDSMALAYTVEKTMRIVSATVRMASFLECSSIVRKDIERTALNLVKDAGAFAHSERSRKSFEADASVLAALLTTAAISGLLSPRNTSIIVEELSTLVSTISRIGTLHGRAYFDAGIFGVELSPDMFASEPKSSRETYGPRDKDSSQTSRFDARQESSMRSYQTQRLGQAQLPVKYHDRVQEAQKDRRATILGLLQKKDRITVKDVANIIRDCSEKTIQRELAALVSQGVLKREGERRWSTYSLV